jgi:general secretion pathway protein G
MKIKIKNLTPKTKLNRAFTLVEILLVVAIIGILAGLVIPRIVGRAQDARITRVQADIKGGVKSAIDMFEVDNGYYPSSLQDMIQKPRNAGNWHGPYFENSQLPVDPWGHPYLYACPGKHNPTGYDLWSAGPPNENNPIGNWQTQ